jgi:hypothetical protein
VTRQPDSDEPIDQWTLLPDEHRLVAGKPTTNRLGFALMLKFFARRGRFHRGRWEVPNAAIEYVAKQVEVSLTEFAAYEQSGRTVERHRAQIREAFGPVSPHRLRHFLFTWLKTQGLDDA